MKLTKLAIILCVITVGLITPVQSALQYEIDKLSSIDGLPHNDTQDMYQDSFGFVWITTNGGLSRYDGYEFVNYTGEESGLTSILTLDICEDEHRNLWISTADKGLYYYLRAENRFIHASSMCDIERVANLETVRHICVDEKGDIWFYARLERSIMRMQFDFENLKITSVKLYEVSNKTTYNINCILSAGGQLFVGSFSGLLRYSPEEDKFVRMAGVSGVIADMTFHNERLYVLTGKQLYSYDGSAKKMRSVANFVWARKMCWSANSLYVTSARGIFSLDYDPDKDVFSEAEQFDRYKNYSISDMISLRTGELIVCFLKEAMRIYTKNTKPFQLISEFGNNHIAPMFEDKNGVLWVGTNGDGYYIINNVEEKRKIAGPLLNGEILSCIVYSDHTSKYYIASDKGLYSQSSPSAAPVMLESIATSKQLCPDGKYLWIASYSLGLIRYNLDDDTKVVFTPENSVLKNDIVRNVIKDRDGNLWIATSAGLYMISKQDKASDDVEIRPILPEQTSTHYIIPLLQSDNGDIWYGTLGKGLFCLSYNNGEYAIEGYNTQNLLSSNIVNSLTKDLNGDLWISHNSSLCKIDLMKHESTVYDLNNGLRNYGFYDLSSCCTKDGLVMFGGANGISAFDPQMIKVDRSQGELRLVDFKIFNESVLGSDYIGGIANDYIEQCSEIKLLHHQNSFAFVFSGFNFTNTKNQKYAYVLSDFDRQWTVLEDGDNQALYTNIPHGKYIFTLRTANCDGVWSDEQLQISLVVAPPFWATWYAYLCYVLIVVLIVYFVASYYRHSLQRENAVKFARMEKAKVQELLTARTRFITNVSHEFRTPLTLILSPLQAMMSDEEAMKNPKWKSYFNTMLYNGETLMRLMSDFLSFLKRDNHNLKLNLQLSRFDTFVEMLSSHLAYFGDSKGVKVEYKNPGEAIYICFDSEHVEQIVYNLLSNAIKHTPSGGTVSLCLINSEHSVELIVKDSGEGIPLEMQPHIFERFVSLDSNIGGVGIGLSLTKDLVELHNGTITFESVENEGTTFSVVFPKERNSEVEDEEAPQEVLADGFSQIEEMSAGEISAGEMNTEKINIGEINAEERNAEELAAYSQDSEEDGKKTLLIVDDNEQILKLLSVLFNERFSVLCASNGVEGYEMAQKHLPDFIISDVMMPLMDGLEFCNKVKENKNTSHIPVVLLSAKASMDDMAEGYRHQADGYCAKPFNNIVLLELVASIINNRMILAQRGQKSESGFVFERDDIIEQDKVLLKKIVAHIEQNIGDAELKVSDICEAVGLRQVILNKKLKSLLDMTCNSLIRSVRLKRAAELLRTGRYTVSSVTYDMGFIDLRHFRNSFKKEFGVFPQEYKSKHSSETEAEI